MFWRSRRNHSSESSVKGEPARHSHITSTLAEPARTKDIVQSLELHLIKWMVITNLTGSERQLWRRIINDAFELDAIAPESPAGTHKTAVHDYTAPPPTILRIPRNMHRQMHLKSSLLLQLSYWLDDIEATNDELSFWVRPVNQLHGLYLPVLDEEQVFKPACTSGEDLNLTVADGSTPSPPSFMYAGMLVSHRHESAGSSLTGNIGAGGPGAEQLRCSGILSGPRKVVHDFAGVITFEEPDDSEDPDYTIITKDVIGEQDTGRSDCWWHLRLDGN
jgi:hypothetical protein